MLGSQAFHAWTDDSLFLRLDGKNIKAEVESKNDQGGNFTIEHIRNKSWTPRVTHIDMDEQEPEEEVEVRQVRRSSKPLRLVTLMEADGRQDFSARDLAELLGIDARGTYKPIQRALKQGAIVKQGSRYSLNGYYGSLDG